MSEQNVFKAFSDFGTEDIRPEAEISRRMLSRLENIENPTTAGPVTPAARAALASSVVAHAVVELENQFIELRKQLSHKAM
jgi:hypothetical protein